MQRTQLVMSTYVLRPVLTLDCTGTARREAEAGRVVLELPLLRFWLRLRLRLLDCLVFVAAAMDAGVARRPKSRVETRVGVCRDLLGCASRAR